MSSRPQPALGFAMLDPYSEPPPALWLPSPGCGQTAALGAFLAFTHHRPGTPFFFHLLPTPTRYTPSALGSGTASASQKKKKKLVELVRGTDLCSRRGCRTRSSPPCPPHPVLSGSATAPAAAPGGAGGRCQHPWRWRPRSPRPARPWCRRLQPGRCGGRRGFAMATGAGGAEGRTPAPPPSPSPAPSGPATPEGGTSALLGCEAGGRRGVRRKTQRLPSGSGPQAG